MVFGLRECRQVIDLRIKQTDRNYAHRHLAIACHAVRILRRKGKFQEEILKAIIITAKFAGKSGTAAEQDLQRVLLCTANTRDERCRSAWQSAY
jgi:hypothetical protein